MSLYQTMTNAILIGLITQQQDERLTAEYLDELAFLATTAGVTPVKRFTQQLPLPNGTTYVGEGKLQEIKQFIESRKCEKSLAHNEQEHESIDLVLFDDELSPRQLRNIEKVLNIPVQDRTSLILDIFAQRAQTSYAKTQVNMARLQYMLPRLTRMWSHLDRLRGGSATNRGTGETQIETDRRIIQQRISLLREELKRIDKQMETQRRNRGKLVRVALVGYTNVGKSTLMNLLSHSEVFAENKLFATLDTTVRKVTVQNLPFLLTDTVGFIRKLPTGLIESFKSTLDEVREADLLLHVVDISHPAFEDQVNVVRSTLSDLGVTNCPTIMIFNKVDAFTYTPKDPRDLTPVQKENISLDDFKKTWMARMEGNCVFISAKERLGIIPLKQLLYNKVRQIHIQRFPYNDFLYPDIALTES